jgi:hypothetical protein
MMTAKSNTEAGGANLDGNKLNPDKAPKTEVSKKNRTQNLLSDSSGCSKHRRFRAVRFSAHRAVANLTEKRPSSVFRKYS